MMGWPGAARTCGRPRAAVFGVLGVELDVDHPADANLGHGEVEMAQRSENRLALWIEDAGLRTNRPSPSSEHDLGVGEVDVEADAGQRSNAST